MSTELGLIRRLEQRVNTLYQESFRIKGDLQQSLNVTRAITAATPSVGDLIAGGASGLVRVPAGVDSATMITANGEPTFDPSGRFESWSAKGVDLYSLNQSASGGSIFASSAGGLGNTAISTYSSATGYVIIHPFFGFLSLCKFLKMSWVSTLIANPNADPSQPFIPAIGFGNAVPFFNSVHGVWIYCRAGVNDGDLVVRTRAASVDTDIPLGVRWTDLTPAYDYNWSRISVEWDYATKTVTFFVNGVQVASVDITAQTAIWSGSAMYAGLGVQKESGTTARAVYISHTKGLIERNTPFNPPLR